MYYQSTTFYVSINIAITSSCMKACRAEAMRSFGDWRASRNLRAGTAAPLRRT